jgi:fatty-acyl-CoA synthase
MHGLMMNDQLTLPAVYRRAETLFGGREVISELADKSVQRTTYQAVLRRARKLAVALRQLGVRPGDRVATLAWNHHRHLEAYFGITAGGAVLHTLNLRMHANDLAYIANHADDRAVIVDEVLLPLLEQFRGRTRIEHVIVVSAGGTAPPGTLDYEAILGGADDGRFRYPELHEDEAAALCYTSGTTGQPKGVLYSHRALALHSLALALAEGFGLTGRDVVFPVVPMFHANAWGVPFTCAMVGARLVLAGPHFDVPAILGHLERERVTVACGVPTIWLGVLQELDRSPGARDLSRLRLIVVAGSAAPRSLIEGFQERHGVRVLHLWGMTELSPVGTICELPPELCEAGHDERYTYQARQGVPLPFIEVRARGPQGLVAWDGRTPGELEVRGPWVARAYYNCPEGAPSFTDDGWFRTGDIVTIDAGGCIQIQDRAKDVIKSGGEWISSVALENALMGHPAVAEAAVVAVAHATWQERPLAAVVVKPGCTCTAAELLRFLEPQFAKWWLPDAVVFVPEIPRTSAGKFLKKALREKYRDYLMQPVQA